MSVLFIIGLILILVFGFSVSAYVTYYKFTLKNLVSKVVVFLLLGAVVSLATFTISLALIWPPVM
jgi:hypothetical protein